MGWSMFLESLFATIGTAVATGGYIYFVLRLVVEWFGSAGFIEDAHETFVTVLVALATVLLFAFMQWTGARQQARLMEWMTYGAILGLVWFWIACIPGVKIERILTTPLLTEAGWLGVIKAIPYAIWWLVIIESVVLAAEEAHQPHRSIPRGMILAQLTLIALVLLTLFFAAAAGDDFTKTGNSTNLYPLPQVYHEVWPGRAHLPHLIAFSLVAICGMAASYNGMIYAVSRQSFALGRAGYLPRVLGEVHAERRTPTVSIVVWSTVIAGFVVWNCFRPDVVELAVLTCNLSALIWYALAMISLFVLRVREPNMPRPYRVPWYPVLPAAVLVMSLFSAAVYGWLKDATVIWLTASMYAVGCGYYFGYARSRLEAAAPEELSARAAAPQSI
jgi:ethanolamine permease